MVTENDEFDKALSTLCAGFNVPCTPERREAYGKGFRKIPPPAWERLVEYCLGEKGPDRMPSVRDLWMIRKEMRAPAALQIESYGLGALPKHGYHGDGWDVAANLHLLGYITTKLMRDPRRYGDAGCYLGEVRYMRPESAHFRQNVSDLVHAKNCWAKDIRDLHGNGDVPVEIQKSVWHDYLRSAEKVIAERKIPDQEAA